MVELRVLGDVGAWIGDRRVEVGHARQRCVFAVLVVEANQVVTVDQLLERVWSEDLPHRGRLVLRTYLSRLRLLLAPEGIRIERRPNGYVLLVDPDVVDLHRFRHLIARARDAGDEHALGLFDQVLALWRGEPFAGLETPWLAAVRASLQQERMAARLDRIDVALRCGQHTEVLPELFALADQEAWDERVAAQFMLALHRAGRTVDALAHYRQLRARLIEQLGTEPGTGLQDLHQRILDPDPALTAPSAAAITGETAAKAEQPVPRQLPAPPRWFTGRGTELARLDQALTAEPDEDPLPSGTGSGTRAAATVVISAIGGAGGIGKTWLALTWANRNLRHFPDGQLAVDLRGFSPGDPKQATDVLAGFLTALGVDRNRQPQDLDARAALYRSHTVGKRMLILLDNAATPDQIVPLLPGGDSCTVLITSRHRLPAVLTRHGAHPVHLDVLTDTETRTLLGTAIGDGTTDAQRAITELIGLCRGFPLALGLIAARIRTQPDLLNDLVTELRDLGLDALDSDDPDASLPTVLSWSLRHLTDQQRTLFGLLGIAPGPDTTQPAVAALTDLPPTAARKALSALEEVSLLERRPQGRYGMHDLVRDYAATTAQHLPDDVREAALVRVMDFHLHTAHTADRLLDPHGQILQLGPPAPGVHPHPLPDAAAATTWLEAEHATLLSTQRTAGALGHHHVAWHLAWALDTFHLRRGHLHDALDAWRAALEAAAHLPDPTTHIHTHRLLGRVCFRLNLHEEATGHLNRALNLAERHHDPTQRAFTHKALARAWAQQGDYRQALDHARHALDLFHTLDRPTSEADALSSVGWYAARLGDFDTARDHCRAALTLNRRHRNLEGEAVTLDKFGLIAHRTGDHRQAIDYYHQALTLFHTLSHIYHVATTLDNVGHPLAALGQHEQARAVWGEALELYREQGRDYDAERVQRQLDDLALAPESIRPSDAAKTTETA